MIFIFYFVNLLIRQSLNERLRKNPSMRTELEAEISKVNKELMDHDADYDKTLNSTLEDNWQDDNYSILQAMI
jgi:hypothetical protein